MFRVLALTEENGLYAGVRDFVKKDRGDIGIITYSSTVDLLEKFSAVHTDLVILDVDILDDQALKLINILRSIKKDSRIMLILSKDKMAICSAAFSLGIVSYLVKPITTENLYDIIASVLLKH